MTASERARKVVEGDAAKRSARAALQHRAPRSLA